MTLETVAGAWMWAGFIVLVLAMLSADNIFVVRAGVRYASLATNRGRRHGDSTKPVEPPRTTDGP